MTQKKKSSELVENEHMALEEAMSELSRQTDALLTQTKTEKKSKPKLPTKKLANEQPEENPKPARKVIPHRKGAHLDIVGHGSVKINVTNANSTLKDIPDHELLPEHAGLSKNEKPSDITSSVSDPKSDESKEDVKSPSLPAAVIRPHVGQKINMNVSAEGDEPTKLIEKPDSQEEKIEKSEEKDEKPKSETTKQAAPANKPKAEKVEGSKAPGPVEEEVKAKNEPELSEKEEDSEPKSEVKKSEPEVTVSDVDAKPEDDGIIKLTEDQKEKPTVFDTAQYHVELHDWSKLSHSSHWSVFILLLLVALAGGLAYLYFTNQIPQF